MINLENINKAKQELLDSSFFAVDTIKTSADLKVFMKSHVYSVWDFMSLLKFIQNEITYNDVPWKPTKYWTNLARFINEIVLEEETDISTIDLEYLSHFELYLKSMEEIWIDTTQIKNLIYNVDYNNLDDFLKNENIPKSSREFMKVNFNYIKEWDILKVVSAFTFWRENIIPEMFIRIIKNLEISNLEAPTLYFYFKRHIELDGDLHGPLSMKLLEKLADWKNENIKLIEKVAIETIGARKKFWEWIKEEIENK